MIVVPDTASSPTRWYAHQIVAHRITGRVGEVRAIDFEESLVTVTWRGDTASQDWTGQARMENLWEVGINAGAAS